MHYGAILFLITLKIKLENKIRITVQVLGTWPGTGTFTLDENSKFPYRPATIIYYKWYVDESSLNPEISAMNSQMPQ